MVHFYSLDYTFQRVFDHQNKCPAITKIILMNSVIVHKCVICFALLLTTRVCICTVPDLRDGAEVADLVAEQKSVHVYPVGGRSAFDQRASLFFPVTEDAPVLPMTVAPSDCCGNPLFALRATYKFLFFVFLSVCFRSCF